MGRFVAELTAEGDRWFAVCIADDDLDATAARLGLEVVTGERERPDGTVVRWRSAGFEDDPERVSRLPFFIEWDVPPELHPGRTQIEHRVAATGIAWIEMGDDGHLTDWLGERRPADPHHRRFVGPASGEPVDGRRRPDRPLAAWEDASMPDAPDHRGSTRCMWASRRGTSDGRSPRSSGSPMRVGSPEP